MSARLHELEMRRERLIARAADQRAVIAVSGSALLPGGNLADRVLLWKRLVSSHPGWAAAALAAGGLLVARRRSAALWLGRGWIVWRAWQGLQAWLKRPAPG